MPKTFAQIQVGEQFEALGERLIKTGPLTYRSIDNPTMGEYQAGPILDRQIDKQPASLIKTSVKVTKNAEVDEVARAIAQGQSTPIAKKAPAPAPKKAAKKTKKRK
jgi:hypothetical protein